MVSCNLRVSLPICSYILEGSITTALAAPALAADPGKVLVKLETTKGDITLELDKQKAPISVENFLRYVRTGHYDGTIFHRVINGFMGFGLPTAIGAALANPGSPVVCFSGDGSLQMNIQELATAAETGANVTIILADNGGLGLVQQQQDLFYGRRIFGSGYRHHVDFIKIAEGFGVRALDLTESKTPMADLERALKREGPCLVRIRVEAQDNVYPMVPPGAGNTNMICEDAQEERQGGTSHAA